MTESKIYKYGIFPGEQQSIMMSENAQILSAGVQNNRIVIWVLVNPAEPYVSRSIMVIGTGWSITDPEMYRFVGTVQINWLVWHVFERKV